MQASLLVGHDIACRQADIFRCRQKLLCASANTSADHLGEVCQRLPALPRVYMVYANHFTLTHFWGADLLRSEELTEMRPLLLEKGPNALIMRVGGRRAGLPPVVDKVVILDLQQP